MAFQRFTSSTGRTNIGTGWRFDGSKWVEGERLRRFDGSKWVTLWEAYTPLRITANAVIASGQYPGDASGRPNTSVSGGNGSLSYTWTVVEPGAGIFISSTTAANPLFYKNTIGHSTATYRVTVTDGRSSASATVVVTLTVLSSGGPGPIPV